MNKVGVLGPQFTFHDLAAKAFLPAHEPIYFQDFNAIFSALEEGLIESALIAVYNSLAGSVGHNKERIAKHYRLMSTHDFPIHLCLGAIKRIELNEIKQVYSHAMAIKETQKFFQQHPYIIPKIDKSTSESITKVKEDKTASTGVIASAEAIEAAELVCLKAHIEDHSRNYTTFAHIALVQD